MKKRMMQLFLEYVARRQEKTENKLDDLSKAFTDSLSDTTSSMEDILRRLQKLSQEMDELKEVLYDVREAEQRVMDYDKLITMD